MKTLARPLATLMLATSLISSAVFAIHAPAPRQVPQPPTAEFTQPAVDSSACLWGVEASTHRLEYISSLA